MYKTSLYTILNWPFPKTSCLADLAFVQAELYGRFCSKIANFYYHGNKDRPTENLNGTINSAVPENPLFGANSVALVYKPSPSYVRLGK